MPGRHLTPIRDLERDPEGQAGDWLAPGPDPQFHVDCSFPAGWVRVRIRMTASTSGWLELYADMGGGFMDSGCGLRVPISRKMDRSFFLNLPRPVRAFRFDPIDCPGRFHLDGFSIAPLSGPALLWQSLRSKLHMLWQHGKIGAGLWKGLKLLARGQFREIVRSGRANLETGLRPGLRVNYPDPSRLARPGAVQGNPRVSIIIPSACAVAPYYIFRCAASIRRLSSYSNYEILLLHSNDLPADLAGAIRELDVTPIRYEGAFNWSRVNNLGAGRAAGEHLLFLNDDTEVIDADWLQSMLAFSQQPDVGVVGAKLLFPDGRLQHGGIVFRDGLPYHANYLQLADITAEKPREWPAVTGACLMTRADVFRLLGGFNEAFPLHYNDIDYCLRVRHSGLRVVCTPQARLYHFESATLGKAPMTETGLFRQLWNPVEAAH